MRAPSALTLSALFGAALATNMPTHAPVPMPTAHPTKVPSPAPSSTPVPSNSYDPTGLPTNPPLPKPSPVPSYLPTREPTPKPTPVPTEHFKPTNEPSPAPSPFPTHVPTTQQDYYPKYMVSMLIDCIGNGGNKQGPVNHTYELSLQANVGEYETANTVRFNGLGFVDEDAQPVDFDKADELNGTALSCSNFPAGSPPEEYAFIHNYYLGSAVELDFRSTETRDVDGVPTGPALPTQADLRADLSEVCMRQTTNKDDRSDGTGSHTSADDLYVETVGHDGVSLNFLIQEIDVTGTTTWVSNETMALKRTSPTDPYQLCAPLHALRFETKFGNYHNVSDFVQNSIPWEMRIAAEFDADISLLAFTGDDNVTLRSERQDLTWNYGERLVSQFTEGSIVNNPKFARDWIYESTYRVVEDYALATVYDPRYGGKTANASEAHLTRMCDDECEAKGGKFQSWQPHVVVEWNISETGLKRVPGDFGGNPNSRWVHVRRSTYQKELHVKDERRYFAVTYDRTPPPVHILKDSVRFQYAYNETKCGNRKVAGGTRADTDFVTYIDIGVEPYPECFSTSTEDTLSMQFEAQEEGHYYFYAHPAYDRQGLEFNFSGFVGIPWPYSIKDTEFYVDLYLCGPFSEYANCDSTGDFPRVENVTVPMDAEAFMFGYDFSFSKFAIYTYAEDDGYISENEGWEYNQAPYFNEWRAYYGNLSYPLVAPALVKKLEVLPITYRSNYYNETEWSASRYEVVSTQDSRLDQVIELVPEGDQDERENRYPGGMGWTTEFGKRCKVFFKLRQLANEFDYISHRNKYYNHIYNEDFWRNNGADTDDDLKRSDVENYLPNTDSWGKYNYRKNPKENYEYNITRTLHVETVFMPDSSDYSEALASADPSGGPPAAIILNKNLTSYYSQDYFYMVGQHDSKKDGDQVVMAKLRLMYSNDPLFAYVPVDAYTFVPIVNKHQTSLLADASTVMDERGYSPVYSLPTVNVTVKNSIDYTTDAGGLCTLLVSLTEKPSGMVKLAVSVPNKVQAQLYQGKNPLLIFSPTNYENLEVTVEGLNDNDNTNGDVPFDVAFSMVSADDPRFLNRYEAFNFAITLTNLATSSDTRLAVGLNNSLCHTSENGNECVITLAVCSHDSSMSDAALPTAQCVAPFSGHPIFTNGITKVVVELEVANRFESEITAVASNGRFDASSSRVQCERGRTFNSSSAADACKATVTFEPYAMASSGNSDQGPFFAQVTLTGVDDFVLDGPQANYLKITAARVVRGPMKNLENQEAADDNAVDVVLYKTSHEVINNDDDYSRIRMDPDFYGSGNTEDSPFFAKRYLEVTPSRCETSESSEVGACPVTVTVDFDALNRSVTSEHDLVECARVTMDLAWYFDNTTAVKDALAAMQTAKLARPNFRMTHGVDFHGEEPRVFVDCYDEDGVRFTGNNLKYCIADDYEAEDARILGYMDKSIKTGDGANMLWHVTDDFCLPPGNLTGWFYNATRLYQPGLSPGGGWVASAKITGTDTVLYTSIGLGYDEPRPHPNQIGNFSFEIPTAGIPISLNSNGAKWVKVKVIVSTTATGLELASTSNTSAVTITDQVNTPLLNEIYFDATFESTGTLSFTLDSADDDVDDEDSTYTLQVYVEQVKFNLVDEDLSESSIKIGSFSTGNGGAGDTAITSLEVTHYDDDTAGLLLQALDSPDFYAYRTDRVAPSDEEMSGHRFFGMRHNQTSEGYVNDKFGDPLRANMTYFNVSLASQPLADVKVSVKAAASQSAWGWRVEGVPVDAECALNTEVFALSNGYHKSLATPCGGGTYVVKTYASPSPWITGSNDTVVNLEEGELALTFTPSNWHVPQMVVVQGLDDFEDDGDRDYTMKLTATSTDLYYDSNANASKDEYSAGNYTRRGYLPTVTVPLKNLDDDTASFVAMQNGTECSEPYYRLDSELHMYLTSKPASVVSVYLESSLPNEAGPVQQLVAITPDNWETMKAVKVSSVDDFAADGDVNFTVSVDLFYSNDAQYGDADKFDRKFSFVSVDDPNDALGVGAAVLMEVTSDVDYTTALGGSMDLAVSLSYPPQEPVFVGVSTSNLDQAVLTTASTLVFTPDNYAVTQHVSVTGVDDMLRYGDTTYQIVLGLIATADPYYERFAFGPDDTRDDKTVNFEVINHDYPWARVRVGMMSSATMTSEGDATHHTYANLTLGLCQAIYGAIEESGTPGTPVAAMADDASLCGGYDLKASELFGSMDQVSFVTVTVMVSDTSEAQLACAPEAYMCDAAYDGSWASLVFDMTGYSDLSSFEPQLYLMGVDDYSADGDVMYTVKVKEAAVKYNKERHVVLDSYLPAELTFTNVDDDASAAAEDAFFTVDPKLGCHVYEGGSHGANGTDCALSFAFADVVKKTFDTVNNNYFYLATLTLKQPADSAVYFSGVMGGGDVRNGSTCGMGPGCGDVTLWWPETTSDWSALAATVQLATVDDWLDDGDKDFNVTVEGSVVFGCSDQKNPTVDTCTGVLTSGGNVTYMVRGQEMDDDTAGLVFSQGTDMFYSYRKARTDGLEAGLTSLSTVELPSNTTSESGGASSNVYVDFNVALSSEPEEDVTVTFYAVSFNDEYGVARYEGIPTLNRSKIDGGGYVVDSYVSPADWVNASSSKDTLMDPAIGGLALTFTPMNWNMPQTVSVIGLDDLAADGDKPFNVDAMVVGTAGDGYRYAPEENLFDQAVRLPFLNLDDEQATVGYSAEQVGAVVAEPFFGDSARIEVYTTTEPSDVIWLSFSSTKPWIANTTHELVAITPSNWDQKLVVHVNAVDNFMADGNSSFEVEMLVLGSSDQAYGKLMQNQTFAFTKLDDPDDAGFSGTSGVAMEFMWGRNLAGVIQDFTTEYGGDGSILGDAEKSGSATLQVRLSKLPQDAVTYAVTSSDTTEGQVLYPSVVVFTPENYYEWQEVVVIGRSDTIADGDVTYDLEFHLLGTNDPYYRALPLEDTTQSLKNQDTIEQRVALGMSSLGCYNITEGTDASRGYAVSGTVACVVQFTICLSDTGTCTQELTAQEVYNTSTSEALGFDSIALDVYMNDTAVAYLGQPQFNHGQINVTSDGSQSRVVLGLGRPLETSFNLTVYATDDVNNDQKRDTELSVYGVLRRETNMGTKEIQEFVNYYDDSGDVTFSKDKGGGEMVNFGAVPIIVRDDEFPDLRFWRVSSGCETSEVGRLSTPGLAVSEGTCLVYVRLGAEPASDVTVSISSSDSTEGKFMLGSPDGTDSVDVESAGYPVRLVDSAVISFDATNWFTPVKVVVVGTDDTEANETKGEREFVLSAAVTAGPAPFNGLTSDLVFDNGDDDSVVIQVAQNDAAVGARTADSVDEVGTVAKACKAFEVLITDQSYFDASGVAPGAFFTIAVSDDSEVLVSLTCDGTYAPSIQLDDTTLPAAYAEINSLVDETVGATPAATFYYRGVDDNDNDGDVEFKITITARTEAYTGMPEKIASYAFYSTNYDDDSLVLSNPDALQGSKTANWPEAEKNLKKAGVDGECSGNACQHTVVLQEPIIFDDDSLPDQGSNKTAMLVFSYPDYDTWNASRTDYTEAEVQFAFSDNAGQFRLDFAYYPAADQAGRNDGCTTAKMNAPLLTDSCRVTLDSADQTFTVQVTAIGDDVDRGGHSSNMTVTTTMTYRERDSTTGALTGTTATKTAKTQIINLVIVEDDTAGLFVNQTDSTSGAVFQAAAYRDFPRDVNQVQDATMGTIALPAYVTKESGGNVTFSVALTSEPLVDAYVYVYSEQVVRSDGSETRYEAIPWPSTYDWTKLHPPGGWTSTPIQDNSVDRPAHLQREDIVKLAPWTEAAQRLVFTPANWKVAQLVTIVGLNDLYDDSTVNYNIYLKTSSSSTTGADPSYDMIGDVTMPMANDDDDTAGLGAYWDDFKTGPTFGIVSEPFFNYDATLYFYLTSKPADTVLVTIVSSAPTEAVSAVQVAAIGPSDWDRPDFALISGLDDAVLDGTQNFTITLSVVYSGDSNYGTAAENADGVSGRFELAMPGYALDDPTDVSATQCTLGAFGIFSTSSSTCAKCPAGEYAETGGDKLACRQCPPGTFGYTTGAQAFTISKDFYGDLLPPGCLPCPNGTYASGYGSSECTPCPDGKVCWPLATVTPKNEKPWEQWASSFDRRWTQVTAETFSAAKMDFFGESVQMNRDQYEAYLLVNGFAAWCVVAVLLLLFSYFGPRKWRDVMVRCLRAMDVFPRHHATAAKNEEYAETAYAPSALGGVVTLGLFTLGLLATSIMFHMYVHFNTVSTSQLDVYNTSFVEKTAVDLSFKVTFVGFSGCDNATFLPDGINTADGVPSEKSQPSMIATGVSYESREVDYMCNNGDLEMELTLTSLKVLTVPKFTFKVAPECIPCFDSGVTPGYYENGVGNTVLNCPSCTIASAQAFKYAISATANYPGVDRLHLPDDNFVNGSEVPARQTDVFRGEAATEVEVNLMPADYENRQTAKREKAYRLVYSESNLGDTQGFHGAYDFYGASTQTAPGVFEAWAKDDRFVETGVVNQVAFVLAMPLASHRVTILVDNAESFLDLWGQVGGVLGLLVAIFLLALAYVERSYDAKDPIGKVALDVAAWYAKKRFEFQSKWDPEPETWTMSNINKMQRREEKREGGARKVEDAAVANFKDLYSRNVIGAAESGGDEEDKEDYDHEVNDFHGQL